MATESGERRILIVEPNAPGHYLWYVKLLVEACVRNGAAARILTTNATAHSTEWDLHLGDSVPTPILSSAEDLSIQEIESVAKCCNIDITVMPSGDAFLASLARRGWKGPGSLRVLFMRSEAQPSHQFRWVRAGKTALKRALILWLNALPRVQAFVLRSPLTARRGPFNWIPDPVSISCTNKDVDSIATLLRPHGDRYWLGIFGAINSRKNVPLVLEAISNSPDVGLVLAGKISPSIEAEIHPLIQAFRSQGGSVVRLDGPLTDAQLDATIAAVHCVVAAHSNEGSSGVVLKAATLGRRLVLAGAKSLRRDAQQLPGQAVWSPLDAGSIRQAIAASRGLAAPTALDLGSEQFTSSLVGAELIR